MPAYRTAQVVELLAERAGLVRVRVTFEPALPSDHPAATADRAYALTQLSGPLAVGHRVLLNTTAVELGLGTGGWHVVVCDLDQPAWANPGPGHILKLRYTPMQVDTGAAEEEPAEPGAPDRLDGLPVAVGTLHSQVPGVVAALKLARPSARVAYVMTDGAALPMAMSDLVVALRDRGLVDLTITAGHAFGGDLEAVNVPSALVLARRHGVDAVVVAMGPGVVGTGTRLGTTALEAAPALDAAAALGGQAIFCARFSSGDQRERHQGLSHHAATVLDLVRTSVTVPVATGLGPFVEHAARRHEVVDVPVPDMAALFADHDLRVTTMGRGVADERDFFAMSGAVGVHVARLLPPHTGSTQ